MQGSLKLVPLHLKRFLFANFTSWKVVKEFFFRLQRLLDVIHKYLHYTTLSRMEAFIVLGMF
jgi:hypothetical protein